MASCGATPVRKGDAIIELQFGVSLVEAIGEQIRELGGEAQWLGSQMAPSPAKMQHMSEHLQRTVLGEVLRGVGRPDDARTFQHTPDRHSLVGGSIKHN